MHPNDLKLVTRRSSRGLDEVYQDEYVFEEDEEADAEDEEDFEESKDFSRSQVLDQSNYHNLEFLPILADSICLSRNKKKTG